MLFLISGTMQAEDILATLEYAKDLSAEFEENHMALKRARARGDREALARFEESARSLYLELAEVRHSLKTGTMPY